MRLDRKRELDYWVGRPLLSSLDFLARVLGWALSRNHSALPVRNVLFVKFQGLGSLVISKPALAAFRRNYPDARCIFWGTKGMGLLAVNMPEFDEVLVLDDRSLVGMISSTLKVFSRLWAIPIDWAFDLEVYSRLSSVLLTLTCARNRAAFAVEHLRSRRVHTHLIYFNRYGYVGEAYARMIGQLLPPKEKIDVSDYGSWRFDLNPLPGVPNPYIVINVHAGELSYERRWPIESFGALMEVLLERRPDITVVLIGHGEAEVQYVSGLGRINRVLDLSGRLSLGDTMRVLANAELLLTNDSGPFHLGLATRTPIVALFGPTRGETYLPPGRPNAIAVSEPIYCSPCVHHWEPPPCQGDNQCLKRLSVTKVLAACESLLGISPHPAQVTTAIPESDYYEGLVYTRATPRPIADVPSSKEPG